jgi:hypothetical protein
MGRKTHHHPEIPSKNYAKLEIVYESNPSTYEINT